MHLVKAILIRPAKKAEPVYINTAEISNMGITGDHYSKEDGKRQVTLISAHDIAEVANSVGFHGDAHIACRRNILIDTFPSDDMKGKVVGLGDEVILEITGYCTPCFRMDENFGEGAIAAFSKKAGWTAKVIRGGKIYVGDKFFTK